MYASKLQSMKDDLRGVKVHPSILRKIEMPWRRLCIFRKILEDLLEAGFWTRKFFVRSHASILRVYVEDTYIPAFYTATSRWPLYIQRVLGWNSKR